MAFPGRLSRLHPDLTTTLVAFPVPVLIAGLLFVYGQLDVAGLLAQLPGHDDLVYVAGAASFLAAGTAHYFGRGRRWRRGSEAALSLVLAIVAGSLVYFDRFAQIHFELFFAGLLSLLMVSGFLRADGRPGAFWLFNLRLGIAVLLASLFGIVFAAGLSAILATIGFLFDLDWTGLGYGPIWVMAMTLVSPVYGLALAPRDLEEEVAIDPARDPLVVRGASVLVGFVLVPLVVVYGLILHVYAAKIVIDGAMPKNLIALMVAIFAAVGSATWLIAWPWRESGTRLLRVFVERWFWLTLVPLILLVVAIEQRVADYGITPDRYAIILVALWLIGLAPYLVVRRGRADIRVPVAALSALMLVGSGGPWGARSVTAIDQLDRLVVILEGSGSLDAAGRYVRPAHRFDRETESRVASILVALEDVGGVDRLRPFFEGQADDPFARAESGSVGASEIARVMDVDLGRGYGPMAKAFVFSASEPVVVETSGSGRLIGPISIGQGRPWKGADGLEAAIEGRTIVLTLGGRRLEIGEGELEALADRTATGPTGSRAIEVDPRLTVILDKVYGRWEGTIKIETVVLWLVVRDEPAMGS